MTPETDTWHDEAIALLRNRPRSMTIEYCAENLGVSVDWLRALMQRRMKDPGVNKIQAIHNLFKNQTPKA